MKRLVLQTDGMTWLATAVAVAAIAVTALLGPPESTQFSGHDAPFAITTLAALHEAWGTAPGIPPGWLATAYGGYGAPVLFFYAPLGFLLAQIFAAVGLADASSQLVAAVALARLAGLAFCFLWLRCFANRPAALLGAAAYGLFPYNALFNPIVRFAFAETVASGLLPLPLLAIAAPGLAPRRRVLAIGFSFAVLGITHVPATLMVMIRGGAYALALGWGRVVESALGFALGLGLIAFYLVPALLLSPEVSTAALMDEGHSWRGSMLFWGSMATGQISLIWMLLYAFFALAAVTAAAAWFATSATPARRAVLCGSLLALAFATPLTLPAWALLPPFDFIQFPWRFLMPASLFFAAQVALLCDAAARRPAIRRALGFGVVLLAAVPPLVAMAILVAKPQERMRFSGGPERTARELAPGQYQPPEYVPRLAREAGWIPFIKGGEALPGVQAEPDVAAGTATVTGFRREGGALRVMGHAVSASALRLPQFWFPGWSLSGSGGELMPDPATGLLRLALPPGPFDVVVERQPLPLARTSAMASLAVLGGMVALLLLPGQARLRGFSGLRPGRVLVRRYAARLGAAFETKRAPDAGGERQENLSA